MCGEVVTILVCGCHYFTPYFCEPKYNPLKLEYRYWESCDRQVRRKQTSMFACARCLPYEREESEPAILISGAGAWADEAFMKELSPATDSGVEL
ncbi:hypothetical protein FQN50_004603 [Emmonsiellopsis sp. PD_5]|nr:hypothetical protein FQN50_004603 [Emmonsiellopsis sp. PD_5]